MQLCSASTRMPNFDNMGAGNACMVMEALRCYPFSFFVGLPLHECAHFVVEVIGQRITTMFPDCGIDMSRLVEVLVLDPKLLVGGLFDFSQKVTVPA